MNAREQRTMDRILKQIAKEVLNLDTLETRKSDSLDFHEHAVWRVKEALVKAYQAGAHETKFLVRE